MILYPHDMTKENLPASGEPSWIEIMCSSIPKYLVPRSVKALDRLIGSAIEIPEAWLRQHRARIDSVTESYSKVESAIADAAAKNASADSLIVDNATASLVRKVYRKQSNLESVAVQTIEDLRRHETELPTENKEDLKEIEDDWLNVFEKYAEDASSERMQNLWGRILAGEIRKPGRFSLRTLRYISEISQSEAVKFEEISGLFFQGRSPDKLINPESKKDISDLLFLEESGLIQGASGLGLTFSMTVPENGFIFMVEGNIALGFKAEKDEKLEFGVVILTKLGTELINLIPDRDLIAVASRVAEGFRSEKIKAAYICPVIGDKISTNPLKVIWEN